MPLSVGDIAPDFGLPDQHGRLGPAGGTSAATSRSSSSSTHGPSPGCAVVSWRAMQADLADLATDDVELLTVSDRLDVRPADIRRPGGLHLPDAL